jgi:hypothetical protein
VACTHRPLNHSRSATHAGSGPTDQPCGRWTRLWRQTRHGPVTLSKLLAPWLSRAPCLRSARDAGPMASNPGHEEEAMEPTRCRRRELLKTMSGAVAARALSGHAGAAAAQQVKWSAGTEAPKAENAGQRRGLSPPYLRRALPGCPMSTLSRGRLRRGLSRPAEAHRDEPQRRRTAVYPRPRQPLHANGGHAGLLLSSSSGICLAGHALRARAGTTSSQRYFCSVNSYEYGP